MPSYADIMTLKAAGRIDDTADDALLQLALDAATAWIDHYCGRPFVGADATAKQFLARHPGRLALPDLRAITAVDIDFAGDGSFNSPLVASDYFLLPLAPPLDPIYTGLVLTPQCTKTFIPGYRVRVTGDWGYVVGSPPTVPTVVEQACLLEAARLFKRKESPTGVLQTPDMATFARIGQLDPDVAALLAPYRLAGKAWAVV